MKRKTNKTTTKKTQDPVVKAKKQLKEQKEALVVCKHEVETLTAHEDMRNAVLIVSLLVNLFVLTAWVTIQVTTVYDYEVAAFIFGR